MGAEQVSFLAIALAVLVYGIKKFIDKLDEGQTTLNKLDKDVAVLLAKIDSIKDKTSDNSDDILKIYELIEEIKEKAHKMGNEINQLKMKIELE